LQIHSDTSIDHAKFDILQSGPGNGGASGSTSLVGPVVILTGDRASLASL
jgi:hypothetical protein